MRAFNLILKRLKRIPNSLSVMQDLSKLKILLARDHEKHANIRPSYESALKYDSISYFNSELLNLF